MSCLVIYRKGKKPWVRSDSLGVGMTNYWLCITTEENWNVVKARKIWAVKENDRKKIDRASIGDYLVFYIKQRTEKEKTVDPQIKGVYEVDSGPFHESSALFYSVTPQEKFVYRVKIKPMIVAEEGRNFRQLAPKMGFIKNKKKWFLSLQFAMRNIPKKDFDQLLSALKNQDLRDKSKPQ